MGNLRPGAFLAVLYPQERETLTDVAVAASQHLRWAPVDSGPIAVTDLCVHSGVQWALIVHDTDNADNSYVLALASYPDPDCWQYLQDHKQPLRKILTTSATHTIYKADEEYVEGYKVAVGHNGPLRPPNI